MCEDVRGRQLAVSKRPSYTRQRTSYTSKVRLPLVKHSYFHMSASGHVYTNRLYHKRLLTFAKQENITLLSLHTNVGHQMRLNVQYIWMFCPHSILLKLLLDCTMPYNQFCLMPTRYQYRFGDSSLLFANDIYLFCYIQII